MNERLRESVSTLMDGEASEMDLQRLLTREPFEQVRDTFNDYQRQRVALDDSAAAFARVDISGAVSAALAQEPAARSGNRWLKPVGGIAVAASVAAAMVVGVQTLQAPVDGGVSTAAAPGLASRVYPAQPAGDVGNVQVRAELGSGSLRAVETADAEAQRKLQQFMLKHTERATLQGGQGMIPFARVVDYEAE